MGGQEFLKISQHERLVEFALRASVIRWLRSCIKNSNGSDDDRRRLKDKTISLIQYDKAVNLNFYRWNHGPYPFEIFEKHWGSIRLVEQKII